MKTELFLRVNAIIALVFMLGCATNKSSGRIILAEGSLCLNNASDTDIFPVLQTKYEEDFGGVSAGDFSVMGFASIDVDKVASIVWAEGKYGSAKKTVMFPVKITEQVAKQTRYLEFFYKGGGEWVLNLYRAEHPEKDDLLVSIPGQLQSGQK